MSAHVLESARSAQGLARIGRVLRSPAIAAVCLAAAAVHAQTVPLIGESVTITFSGTAKPSAALPGFGTLLNRTVGYTAEVTQTSHASYAAYFGNGSISFDLNDSATGSLLSVVYNSGSATAGSKVDDLSFNVQLNNPLRLFAAAPTENFDFFTSRTVSGQGWVATLSSPSTIAFNLLDLTAPTGAGYTTGAEFAFGVYAVSAVPEPGAWALMGLGLAGLGWARRRQGAAAR